MKLFIFNDEKQYGILRRLRRHKIPNDLSSLKNKQFHQLKKFYNDVKIKKKVVSKLGKKTTYSSSSWCNSPEYLRFNTLHQLLEGV